MRQTKATINQEIRRLRYLIDAKSTDPYVARIAYAMETALRWSIEDTVGWSLLGEAKINGELAKQGK